MEERAKRKLSAILSADVKGYSRLMGEDELATVRTLEAYREMIAEVIRNYRGRVVDSPGDNVLAEFASVVDAVESAVEIQKGLKAKNEDVPESRRMEFRIGINLGDVIEEGERIYGDGVNIAARIEGLAEGGGICISRTAYGQVKNKLKLGYEYLGEHSVKNISEPVRVYRVLMEPEAAGKVIGEEKLKPRQWRGVAIGAVAVLIIVAGALAIWNFYFRPQFEPASVEKMAFPLPDKPSIAVLPFVNMSGDPKQDYLSDGITENTITALSQISEMFVIARNSTTAYKDKPVKVQKVSEDLGVRYVLEGSVQRSGDRIRVTAQLIDATKGYHLWSERYDRSMGDLFALQDEITKKIVVALQVRLNLGEQGRIWHRDTNNLEAWSYCVKGYTHFERFTKADNEKARELFNKAAILDPEYGMPWIMIAWTHWVDARFGFSKNRSESFNKAAELAQKALALNVNHPNVHALLGSIYLFQRQYDQATSAGEKAIELGPNNSEIHALMAMTVHYAGKFEEAIALLNKAMRLSPYYPSWYLYQLGESYLMAARFEEAISTWKHLIERVQKEGRSSTSGYLGLAAAYLQLGQEEKAHRHAEEVLKLQPNFSLEQYRKFLLFKEPRHTDFILDLLRKAGLPDEPPLPLPDKPSIAVLPFVNMSGDPEQEYFSDGMTEEIITALSKTPKLFVIARNSTFTYKGKPVKVQQVGRELGVKYVLEGSVRKAEDKVRITAQLVDAQTGHHLWAERYDRELKDIFAIQDEITMKIITELRVKLTSGEQARLSSKGTENLQAYLKYLQAGERFLRMNREDNIKARQMAEEAIALDPGYAEPYRILAHTHVMDVFLRSSKSRKQSLALAFRLAQKVLTMDESSSGAHHLLAAIYLLRRQHEKALAEAQQALSLEPNSAGIHAALGRILYYTGRPEETIPLLERALRLSPVPEGFSLYTLGMAYQMTGRYQEAIEACRRAVQTEPKNLWAHSVLAVSYSLAGREEEARAEVEEVLRIDPKFSLEHVAKTLPFKKQEDLERFVGALRKAGLK